MTFNELYQAVKNKFQGHHEIFLEREKLAIQIANVFDNAFYILWENGKCSLKPYHYTDYDVSINASQHDIEQLFTKRQCLFLARHAMNIKGSFTDVMDFQTILSCITKDNSYVVQEEIISKMLLKQDSLHDDLGVIMRSLSSLLTNSLLDLPEKSIQEKAAKHLPEKKSSETEKAKTVSCSKEPSSLVKLKLTAKRCQNAKHKTIDIPKSYFKKKWTVAGKINEKYYSVKLISGEITIFVYEGNIVKL